MRSTQESGQILRSKKRPRRTLRSGRGSRTNSNTSRQIPARVIDAAYDTLPAAGAPDLCQCRWAIITADVRRFGRLINKEGVLGTRSRRHHHGSGGSRVIRRMLADAHDARLGLCFSWRLLCRKLKHRCLLTLMQVRQENKRAIRKFECVVMHLWYVLVDLSKDRRSGAYCSRRRSRSRRAALSRLSMTMTSSGDISASTLRRSPSSESATTGERSSGALTT